MHFGKSAECINQTFRAARRRCGLSQRKLAKKAGVSDMTISNIETMRHRPADELVVRLTKILRCSFGDIWPGCVPSFFVAPLNDEPVEEIAFSDLGADLRKQVFSKTDKRSVVHLAGMVRDALSRLVHPVHRRVIELRFGIGCSPCTWKRIAKILGTKGRHAEVIQRQALAQLEWLMSNFAEKNQIS